MYKKETGLVDHAGEWTTFGVTMQRVKHNNFSALHINGSDQKGWDAKFYGEGSQDAGGPYREILTNLIAELYTPHLPLLIPTKNQKSDHGSGRDLWTLNPASTSPTHLEMYKFLGALIGLAVRAGHVIDIKFPAIIWKQFMDEKVSKTDLRSTDEYAVESISKLQKSKTQMTQEEFDAVMEYETFTTQLSNGEIVPLCQNGADKKITWENLDEYASLVVKIRTEEASKQMSAMKDGFNCILPFNKLSILSWEDLEERVRGPNEITAEALQEITEYSNCDQNNEYVKRFWRVFENFTNDQKSLFLKFVWGRDRLPPSDRIRERKFKFYLIGNRSGDPNKKFPEAHTCFFQFDMPCYTTDEACRNKIVYAIEMCGDIDTDHNVQQIRANSDDSD